MENGLYVAASGMLMQQQRMDVISNNMANINTTGFKKELALFSDYRPVDNRNPQNLIQKSYYNRTINSSVKLDDIVTNHEQGHLKQTENKFDVAIIDENNFFAVETPFGVRYTRDGEFTMNSEGELVTRDGFRVMDMDTDAPIVIPPDHVYMDITNDGTVNIDNAPIGQIAVVRFEDLGALQKMGRNLYTAVGAIPEQAENPTVMQGYVESSNVNPVLEMVNMVEAARAFEMYQKAVQTHDSLDDLAANTIGRMQ
ncbi:MAG: flagellar basal-body rod protein FlgF [Deferribacteraceae bacterium]|jgi:flagellar basal-body rod protein FlgG|nr:flagellar basal-body rod protein FlgF [Deferribacteraceae bacterium]